MKIAQLQRLADLLRLRNSLIAAKGSQDYISLVTLLSDGDLVWAANRRITEINGELKAAGVKF